MAFTPFFNDLKDILNGFGHKESNLVLEQLKSIAQKNDYNSFKYALKNIFEQIASYAQKSSKPEGLAAIYNLLQNVSQTGLLPAIKEAFDKLSDINDKEEIKKMMLNLFLNSQLINFFASHFLDFLNSKGKWQRSDVKMKEFNKAFDAMTQPVIQGATLGYDQENYSHEGRLMFQFYDFLFFMFKIFALEIGFPLSIFTEQKNSNSLNGNADIFKDNQLNGGLRNFNKKQDINPINPFSLAPFPKLDK